MAVTDMHGTPITEGVWVFDEDHERIFRVDEIREDVEEGNEVAGDGHDGADPECCAVVVPHPAENPEWFRDETGERWVAEVGDASVVSVVYDDELASHPWVVGPRPLRVEVYETRRAIESEPDDFVHIVIEHRWRVVHTSNGEIMAQGEGYADRRDRDHAVHVLFPDVDVIEVEA